MPTTNYLPGIVFEIKNPPETEIKNVTKYELKATKLGDDKIQLNLSIEIDKVIIIEDPMGLDIDDDEMKKKGYLPFSTTSPFIIDLADPILLDKVTDHVKLFSTPIRVKGGKIGGAGA